MIEGSGRWLDDPVGADFTTLLRTREPTTRARSPPKPAHKKNAAVKNTAAFSDSAQERT